MQSNHSHLLQFYDQLSQGEKQTLTSQIDSINFDLVDQLFTSPSKMQKLDTAAIELLPSINPAELPTENKSTYTELGSQAIKAGKYAVIIMAGGRGTRLGHDGPKGTLEVFEGKSIFSILCDSLKEAQQKYGTWIPWYVMTSEGNNAQTIEHFEQKNYFGYPKDKIKFFMQGKLPIVDKDGKVLLAEKGKIAFAPNGSGGIYAAMRDSGVTQDMKNQGITHFLVGNIDNILLKMADPLFLGVAISTKSLITCKTFTKLPNEKVGVFLKVDGKPSVVEYINMPSSMEGMYNDASVNINLLSIDALDVMAELPYYHANKKASYIDTEGNVVVPVTENAIQFESFIFDLFPALGTMSLLKVVREDEFAPIKNLTGVDSLVTARELYLQYRTTA